MVDVLPFRALRYNPMALSGASLAEVTAPPFDVIDRGLQRQLYDRHPANVIRLILNRPEDFDADDRSCYWRAGGFFTVWQDSSTLVPDPKPAIYAYSQTFSRSPDAPPVTCRSLVALLRLEDFESGRVVPHEQTVRGQVGPKLDRMRLMRATRAHLCPVMLIYDDPACTLDGFWPDSPLPADRLNTRGGSVEFVTTDDGQRVTHRLVPLTEPTTWEMIQRLLRNRSLLIADGHHRYETSLAYRDAIRQRLRQQEGQEPPPGSLPCDYVLVSLVNLWEEGLQVLPSHRVLSAYPEGMSAEAFRAGLLEACDAVDYRHAAWDFVWHPASEAPLALRVRDHVEARSEEPDSLRRLDVMLYERVVMAGLYGTSSERLFRDGQLLYRSTWDSVSRRLAAGEAALAFEMNPPSLHDIYTICEAGYRLPLKSTYFFPKPLSGLVFYSHTTFCDDTTHALTGVPLPYDLRTLRLGDVLEEAETDAEIEAI